MRRATALRRELPTAFRIPYRVHVSAHVVRTDAGEYAQVFKLDGASFETADDEVLNNWHERLNVLWRGVAAPNVALWTHVVRRRERARAASAEGRSGDDFAERLTARYSARLSSETLMVNELYLAVVYRPVVGAAPSLLSRLLRTQATHDLAMEQDDALDTCEKLAQTIMSSLARYEPDRLGVYETNGRHYSRVLEFLSFLLNADVAPSAAADGTNSRGARDNARDLRHRDHRIPPSDGYALRRDLRHQGVRDTDQGRDVRRATLRPVRVCADAIVRLSQ